MLNRAQDQKIPKSRVELSVRTIEISQFHSEKSRPKNGKSVKEFSEDPQNTLKFALQSLQNALFAVKYQFEETGYQNTAVSMGRDYLGTVVPSPHSAYLLQRESPVHIEPFTNSKAAIQVANTHLIDVKSVYESLPFDMILFKIKSANVQKCLGYDFRPLPYQQKRTKLMRLNKDKQSKNFLLYDGRKKALSPISIYPFQDPRYNFVMENSSLSEAQCGSPILEEIEHQFYLLGFYCERCLVPIEDFHHILLFNPKILQLLKQSLEPIKAEKALLNYTAKVGKITLAEIQVLTEWQFSNLLVLDLNSNRIGVKGVKKLVKANWSQLRNISLDGNQIDDCCLGYICRANWKRINSLSALNNAVGNEGANSIAKSAWKELSYLNLYKNSLNTVGVIKLLTCDWSILTVLNLQKSKADSSVLRTEKYFGAKLSKLQKFSI